MIILCYPPKVLRAYRIILCSICKRVRLPVSYSLTLYLFVAVFARHGSLQSYNTILYICGEVLFFLKLHVVRCNIIHNLVACMHICMHLFLGENSFYFSKFFIPFFVLVGKARRLLALSVQCREDSRA